MSLILDPTDTSDDSGYDGLRTLFSLDVNDVSNADIDADPLFQDAEEFIVGVVPNSALSLTGAEQGRNYPQRSRVIRALQFLTAYNMISGGSETIRVDTSGTRQVRSESETIGPVTTRTEYADFGASASSVTQDVDDRSQFYLKKAYEILESLTPTNDRVSGFRIPVATTTSRLEEGTPTLGSGLWGRQ